MGKPFLCLLSTAKELAQYGYQTLMKEKPVAIQN